jgi:hypothetical protein
MSKWFANRPLWMLTVGLSVGLLVGVGMLTGALVTIAHHNSDTQHMPEVILNATASHSGDTFAMATGPIDSDVEGLFILDYLTGELHCYVMYPRMGKFGGVFKHNVIADLGVQQGKNPNYVMVTGQAAFQRGTSAQTPAACVVYVADANTGNFAAYTIFFDRTRFRANMAQQGAFQLLDVGKARTLEIRE